MKLKFSQQIFEKYTNIKFNENPSCGSRSIRWGQTDDRTDTTKLIFDFEILRTRLHKSLCMQPTSDVPQTADNLTRKETGKIFGFVLPLFVIKLQVLNYNRICKVLLIIVMVVYNANVKFCFKIRDL